MFAGAYADVSQNFEQLFQTLFPGGTGRLRLTAPDDLLETGIEVEAKPSGKNVRKLSLLSGGERSLTALAFLFAVFRSRPSPFYVMDEVEAALDDVNLHRFLDLVREFRQEAQLIIVSHQKRTMEAADILYGVTMQPGGSSKVVSERVTADLVSRSADGSGGGLCSRDERRSAPAGSRSSGRTLGRERRPVTQRLVQPEARRPSADERGCRESRASHVSSWFEVAQMSISGSRRDEADAPARDGVGSTRGSRRLTASRPDRVVSWCRDSHPFLIAESRPRRRALDDQPFERMPALGFEVALQAGRPSV